MNGRPRRPFLLRPEDLLQLEFEFINLNVSNDDGKKLPYLSRINPAEAAYVVVIFPPQHIAEKAFMESEPRVLPLPEPQPGQTTRNENEPPTTPPVNALIAGESRLVFRIPDTVNELPYTAATLLDWSQYTLSVAPNASPPTPPTPSSTPGPAPAQPLPVHTALELPYRLFISPNETAAWAHTLQPITREGRTELWHTRLGVRNADQEGVDETAVTTRTIRAIWSPDFTPGKSPPQDAFLSSLSAHDRMNLVRLTSDFTMPSPEGSGFYTSNAVTVDQLMLSSLGAWMKTRAVFNREGLGKQGLNIEEWAHITTQGRDQYVRVVYAGYLYPFWHRASLVKITERKIQSPTDDGQQLSAFLRQRLYIIVREPIKRYREDFQKYGENGRMMPFQDRVQITTLVTPNLDLSPFIYGDKPENAAFWIRVGGQDFKFQFIAQDTKGHRFDFTGGLIFVPDVQIDQGKLDQVYQAYHSSKTRRMFAVPNQRIDYAEAFSNKPGETALDTTGLYFTAKHIDMPPENPNEPDEPIIVLPSLQAADVRIPAVEQMVGEQISQTIRLYDAYIHNLPNAAGIFAELVQLNDLPGEMVTTQNAARELKIPPEKAGGISAPNMKISGISQHLGPVAGTLGQLAGGTFSAVDFFQGIDATLLGGVQLSKIVSDIFDDNQFPKLITQPPTPTSIVSTLEWSPMVKSDGFFIASKQYEPPITDTQHPDYAKLDIKARIEKQLQSNADPSFMVNGKLSNFTINFLDVIAVSFNALTFVSKNDEKLQVSADVVPNGIQFLGPLKFLNELQRFIPADGFIDPPYLDVAPTGVTVGYNLGLPPLAMGVFSLQNVSLGAALNLPFTDSAARLRFNFSERHSPFIITVTLFGGGGFFALALGLDGIELIEAALEFGGNVSLDIGVASGGVYVMAGVYFKYEKEDKVQLSGYLRMGGHLSVLGLISVSLEFYLEFSYIEVEGNAKITGRATLTVQVEVLFFSTSVQLTVERTFSSTANDPTYADALTAGDWKLYSEAFAG